MSNGKNLGAEVREMIDQMMVGDEEAASWVKKSRVIDSLVKIPGDASTRRYYRLTSVGRSYILMRMDPFMKDGFDLDFLVVQKHLTLASVEVPAVLDVDPERGFILLEDLGDVTLLRRLQNVSNPDVERHLYERVIDQLVNLQFHASPRQGSKPIDAFKLRFDHEKLMWEMNHTIEHFYKQYLGREIKPHDLKVMEEGLSEICHILANQPVVFTHRDFHSRNVMVMPPEEGTNNDRLVMIDFQDARMGPAQYDLASLLKDSYYQLDEGQIKSLVNYYIARWEGVSQQTLDHTEFFRVFDLMSVQRNFKAIGSFASFMNRRGNPSYLKYIGNTFENIRRTLLKYPEYSELREVLFHYYYF
ncbi:MAG: phosphotransferase [Methylotenera sp.]|nr:phosphotransferase [Oligoflexia bacterium]